jgi:hypothetical protein
MPIWLWLLLGTTAAYLIVEGGKASAAAAGTNGTQGSKNISVTMPNGQSYTVPVDGNITPAAVQQIQTFFAAAGQTQTTVGTLSQNLLSQGYTIAAGTVQNVWQMYLQTLAIAQATPSSSGAAAGAGTGTGIGGPIFNPFQHASSSAETAATQPAYSIAQEQVSPAVSPLAVQPGPLNIPKA